MTITYFIRDEIDPFKKDQFTAYSENWVSTIPRLGGHLLGYFVPHEGSNYEAWGLIGQRCRGDRRHLACAHAQLTAQGKAGPSAAITWQTSCS